ncbi:hypothetical protein BC834DRAFT_831460 [Gloeopeniophorella convolvens]|nr:hypothetical protein BC834DRAFT_831460 [Gloeopeniophorella convolvens]
MPATLALVPTEIIEQILIELDPLDVAAIAQTCRRYNDIVYHSPDSHLWRTLYLAQPFDDPRHALTQRLEPVPPESIDWMRSLQSIMRARTVLADPSRCRPGERATILRTLIGLIVGAAPAPSFSDVTLSENLIWLAAMLRDGVLLECAPDETPEEAQLRSRLSVHLGLTPGDAASATKVAARAFVYDMRNYRYDSAFGPYLPDGSGRVNWVHIHAVHRTVAAHLVDLAEGEPFVYPLIPLSMPYCQSIIPPGLDLKTETDWAGVEGLWHVAFSFIDHRELLQFNTHVGNEGAPLDTTMFQDPGFREVFRVLPMHFRIIGTDPDPERPHRPRLVFTGGVRDGQTLIGRVEMTPDDHVRWKWVSGEDGQAIWSCEGVQIGGIRSSFGILGSWTTVFHDPHDPVGAPSSSSRLFRTEFMRYAQARSGCTKYDLGLINNHGSPRFRFLLA